MRHTVSTLWQHHKFLLSGFVIAMLVAAFLLFRLVAGTIYWSNHRDVQIEGWMTPGYIAHSYNVKIDVVLNSVGMQEIPRNRIKLEDIAQMRGVPLDDLIEHVTIVLREREQPSQ